METDCAHSGASWRNANYFQTQKNREGGFNQSYHRRQFLILISHDGESKIAIFINSQLYMSQVRQKLRLIETNFSVSLKPSYSTAEFPGDIVIDSVSRGRLAIPFRLVSPSIRYFRKVMSFG